MKWNHVVERDARGGLLGVYVRNGEQKIASVYCYDVQEAERFAELMAAAPELAEALQQLVEHPDDAGLRATARTLLLRFPIL